MKSSLDFEKSSLAVPESSLYPPDHVGLRCSVWSHCLLCGLADLAVVTSLSPRIVVCKTGIVPGPASNGLNVKCLVQRLGPGKGRAHVLSS